MLTIFTKKKISEDKAANVFVNSILDVIEKGWDDIAAVIDTDPSFVSCPNLSESKPDKFIMIVVTANLKFLPKYFEKDQENRIKFKIVEKFAKSFGIDDETLYKHIKDYGNFMTRVNHPSKNVLYSMSKALYHKYNLNNCQEEYFKSLNAPNPLLLKRLDEVMENFIWDWDNFLDKYKIPG